MNLLTVVCLFVCFSLHPVFSVENILLSSLFLDHQISLLQV